MIRLLDNLLRHLLMDQITELTDEAQVRFQPPNADWRTYVDNLVVGGNPALALNLYLVDLRENRKLRSNERIRSVENGAVSEEPAPARLDCHYLISAWSPAAGLVEPTLDEHALLYQVAAVLFRHAPFNPSQIYPEGSAVLNAWPAPFHNVDLPAVLLPAEGFNKLAEFWSGMGQGALWKPALYLIVTLPIALVREILGLMVTTRITEYRISNRSETAEVWVQIGGHVLSPARRVAVGSGTVTAITPGGTTVTLNSAVPFREGDVVTANGIARSTITQIGGNDLALSNVLAGLTVGSTLRIANLTPSQTTFRVDDVTGLASGGMALITGSDANNPGAVVTDSAVIEGVAATGFFVTLKATPVRTRTFNLNVAPADAPTLQEALPGVWVELETPTGERLQMTRTNDLGRFTFGELRAGRYRLRARAQGLMEITREVDVPSPSGEYDLLFT